MASNKLFKTLTIILHFCSMALGVVALAFVSCAFAKADLNAIASYLARETGGDMSQTATRVQFLEALRLTGVYSSVVKACCFGLGAIVTSFAGNIMGVIGNVDSKGNR
mgnify:CR=1 FL=1